MAVVGSSVCLTLSFHVELASSPVLIFADIGNGTYEPLYQNVEVPPPQPYYGATGR